MRLNNYSNSESFFSEFEKTVNDLKSAGAKISEKEKLNYMLNSLPDSYSHIGDLIDTLKEEEQTADYIRNKIKLTEMKSKKDHNERTASAFMVNKGECFKCGKKGHYARECQDGGQAGRQGGTWRGATTRGRGQGRDGRGNYTRGSGNYARGRGNSRRQAGAGTSNEQSSEGASAWVATAHAANSSEMNRSCKSENEIDWLLDSGCTDHIINNDRYFEKCTDLKNPVNIYLGDNRSIKATKLGNVVSYFNAFGKINKVNMSNVFYAKDMNTNLISYAKLTKNNTILSRGNVTKIIDSKNKLIAVAFKENEIF